MKIKIRRRPKPYSPVRFAKGRVYSPNSDEIKRFRFELIKSLENLNQIQDQISLEFLFSFKSKCRADIDNLLKLYIDACKSIIYKDDRQIKKVYAEIKEYNGEDYIEIEYSIL